MDAEGVADASLLGAAFFSELHSDAARRYLSAGHHLIAPSLLLVEVASIAAKKVWRKEASLAVAQRALASVPELVAELIAPDQLAVRALELAATHHFSAYDALYLVLAECRGLPLLTFDDRLIARAREAQLSVSVQHPC